MLLILFFRPGLIGISVADTNSVWTLNRTEYKERLRGYWLGSCIANWTGLQTEGARTQKPFFTDNDWGSYGYVLTQNPWQSDDDTDIEYIFQHAMETYSTGKLTGVQIREQWLEHIDGTYIWVSNATAYHLMRNLGLVPPATSLPANNSNWEMIDAQLTTEIFGFMAPAKPSVALDISYLPIRTTAYSESMYAAQFYVLMYSMASQVDTTLSYKAQTQWLASQARRYIPNSSYIAKMYDWILSQYLATPDKDNWEPVRDAFYDRYVVGGADGYTYRAWYDSGCNFGMSIVSLLFGEGNFKKTIKIGTLCGMDSDNPTNGANNAKVFSYTGAAPAGSGDTGNVLILTIAVRNNTGTFSGPAPYAAMNIVDGIKYTVQGGTNLNEWKGTVFPFIAASYPGLPEPGTDYHYQSFALSGSQGLPDKGFMRVKVEPSP